DANRRAVLAVAIVGNVALLGWFKYYGFFAVNVANALHGLGLGSPLPLLSVALPVGISFFTFMGISYVVDVHRGRISPASWLDGAVYLAFFPHLVAGPIVRGSELFPQLRERGDPKRIDGSRAAWLIMAGLAKKVVISSFLARAIVDPVFALPHQHSGLEVLFGIYGYAIQIYADFSGYTDIAIGVALLLGFRFPDNFNAPYAAVSMQDFWRRWHMTLSSWLRDYLYVPLGGNRKGTARTAFNVFVTMLIAGLWHGAAWTFVAWGAYHGAAQVVGMLRRRAGHSPADPTWTSRLITFHLVCLGWVLFRAQSFANALAVLSRLVHPGPAPLVTPLVIGAIVVSIAAQYVTSDTVARLQRRLAGIGPVNQGVVLAGGLYLITLLGPVGVAPFIYYRF
ncbi:MAG: MBOAT family protein, partial [Solirubrobacterales bacterium]|nr:MBOAT family protein [Solirubrobacterales bacterium]